MKRVLLLVLLIWDVLSSSSGAATVSVVPAGTVLCNNLTQTGAPSPCLNLPANYPLGGGNTLSLSTTGGTLNLTAANLTNAVIVLTGTLTSGLTVNWPTTTPLGQWTLVNNT